MFAWLHHTICCLGNLYQFLLPAAPHRCSNYTGRERIQIGSESHSSSSPFHDITYRSVRENPFFCPLRFVPTTTNPPLRKIDFSSSFPFAAKPSPVTHIAKRKTPFVILDKYYLENIQWSVNTEYVRLPVLTSCT